MIYDDEYFAKAEAVIMDVLKKVRPELMAAFGNVEFVLKGDKTVVTELDAKVETLLLEALREFDPEVGFLGEEHGQEGSTENLWTIDPIDGTESFIRGLPHTRNQLAFVQNGQVEYALCYNFPSEDLYIARRGKGTTMNGTRITITPKPLERCWIEVSMDLLDPANYEVFKRLRPQISGATVMHNFLNIVEGHIDGIVSHIKGGPWDYAPASLLLSEAGYKVVNKDFASEYDYSRPGFVVIHPDNFEELQKLLSPQA